jgi:flagellar protein FliS
MQFDPYQHYRENAILTAGQERLALMLFEGAARFARDAFGQITASDLPAAHRSLTRAQDIVEYLAATANTDLEVGRNLAALYDFIYRRLVEANISKDPHLIQEAGVLLEQLRDTWREALDGNQDGKDNNG